MPGHRRAVSLTAAGSSSTSRIRFPTILGWHRRCLVQRRQQPRCRDGARVFCWGKRQPPSGRGWAAGCGAYAAPRSTELVARALQRAACSDSLRLSERSERSSRSEFCNGAMRSSTRGHPACKAGRCIRSRRRRPTRGPSPHSNAVHNGSLIERLLCAVSSREALRNRRRTCVSSARCETPPRWPTGWASAAPRGRAADQSCR